jgi:hypothetical protein
MSSHDTMPPQESPTERQPATPNTGWAWPIACMVIVLLLVSGGVFVFKSCRDLPVDTIEKTGKLVDTVGRRLEEVAAAFNRGTITTTFTSEATTLSGSQYFQFATLMQHEVFTRTDEASTGFGYIPLPEVIVEARAPVTYTYYLDFNARWDFQLKDGVIRVIAPDIKPNKPAVDASSITYEVKKNSMFRNTTEAMNNLKSSITSLSYQKALTNISLVRETGRAKTEQFVENWLERNFSDGKKYPVKVRFSDETQGEAASRGPGAARKSDPTAK